MIIKQSQLPGLAAAVLIFSVKVKRKRIRRVKAVVVEVVVMIAQEDERVL